MNLIWEKRRKCVEENRTGRTLVIYGAGKMATAALEAVEGIAESIVLCDRNWKEIHTVGSYPVQSPEILRGNREKYYVLVSILLEYPEVREFLEACGFEEEKDFCYYESVKMITPGPEGYSDIRGNQIIGDLRGAKVELRGYNSRIIVHENFRASELTIVLHSNAYLEIGEDVLAARGRWKFYDDTICRIGDNTVILADAEIHLSENSRFEIGCNSKFCERMKVLLGKDNLLLIGREALFSKYTILHPANGHPIYDLISGQQLPEKNQIIIHDHVWMGLNVTVLGNTEIGTGCIVGANSLVKGKFSNNCMIAGQMARVIRENIAWSRKYLENGLSDLNEEYRQLTYKEQAEGD